MCVTADVYFNLPLKMFLNLKIFGVLKNIFYSGRPAAAVPSNSSILFSGGSLKYFVALLLLNSCMLPALGGVSHRPVTNSA